MYNVPLYIQNHIYNHRLTHDLVPDIYSCIPLSLKRFPNLNTRKLVHLYKLMKRVIRKAHRPVPLLFRGRWCSFSLSSLSSDSLLDNSEDSSAMPPTLTLGKESTSPLSSLDLDGASRAERRPAISSFPKLMDGISRALVREEGRSAIFSCSNLPYHCSHSS